MFVGYELYLNHIINCEVFENEVGSPSFVEPCFTGLEIIDI